MESHDEQLQASQQKQSRAGLKPAPTAPNSAQQDSSQRNAATDNSSQQSAMTTERIRCGYGAHVVLDGVSLEVRTGEVLVLLGANGSGKTTLLRTLSRQLSPTTGTVFLDQQNIRELTLRTLARQVALAPQTERREWALTVNDSVRLGRAVHRGWLLPLRKEDLQIVDEALQSTGLTELRERFITQLSGGEWRRMILARALVQQAKILLLDEPTASLDLRYQMELLQLTKQLASEQQLAVVVTLHDLNLAAMFADRIAILSDGSLRAVGIPQDVLTAELVSETFGISVTIAEHPVYGTPLVVPLLGK